VHSTKVFQSLNRKCQQAIPFASLIVVLPKIQSSVFANTWFDLITENDVQLVHDSTSPGPNHMLCSIDVFSLSGPRVCSSTYPFGEPQETPFQSTCYVMTVEAIRVFLQN
jgi:hypothetical protein